MIVTPEGLNVFPEDVERVLNGVAGVRESAVVGATEGWQERVHAVLVVDPGTDANGVIRARQRQLCRITSASVAASLWPGDELPRTEGTRKLKRRAVKRWVASGERPISRGRRVTRSRRCRPLRARPRRQRRDDARGARAELARARRADGGARGSLPDHVSTRAGSPASPSVEELRPPGRGPPVRRRRHRGAGRLPHMESRSAAVSIVRQLRWRRGSCRWPACSPI